jgi:arsenate reductase (glutaredoxin)
VPWFVGLHITAAYWFTASTSFGNPAVVISRSLTNTFSGICPADAPAFIAAQLVGAICGLGVAGRLLEQSGDGRGHKPGGAVMTIYHNPNCGTSRNVLAMIRRSVEDPVVIEYLKNSPTRGRLKELIAAMRIPVRALLREKGTPYPELGLSDTKWTDDQLLDFMIAHPILINRPIVVTPKGVRLCRPWELVLDILPHPNIGRLRQGRRRGCQDWPGLAGERAKSSLSRLTPASRNVRYLRGADSQGRLKADIADRIWMKQSSVGFTRAGVKAARQSTTSKGRRCRPGVCSPRPGRASDTRHDRLFIHIVPKLEHSRAVCLQTVSISRWRREPLCIDRHASSVANENRLKIAAGHQRRPSFSSRLYLFLHHQNHFVTSVDAAVSNLHQAQSDHAAGFERQHHHFVSDKIHIVASRRRKKQFHRQASDAPRRISGIRKILCRPASDATGRRCLSSSRESPEGPSLTTRAQR